MTDIPDTELVWSPLRPNCSSKFVFYFILFYFIGQFLIYFIFSIFIIFKFLIKIFFNIFSSFIFVFVFILQEQSWCRGQNFRCSGENSPPVANFFLGRNLKKPGEDPSASSHLFRSHKKDPPPPPPPPPPPHPLVF